MITARCHLGLLLSKFSAELDIHDARPVAADTAGLLLGGLTMASPAGQSHGWTPSLQFRASKQGVS